MILAKINIKCQRNVPFLQMRWDAKKKKYVRADANDKKKIKTESGVWIPASYKSNRYAKWKERSKLAQMQVIGLIDRKLVGFSLTRIT